MACAMALRVKSKSADLLMHFVKHAVKKEFKKFRIKVGF
tara:strand:- start:306 stop:422 length:117 start_codon:yes stop_codon:yes gene_type:complete